MNVRYVASMDSKVVTVEYVVYEEIVKIIFCLVSLLQRKSFPVSTYSL
jgi:hypothetical protein